MSLGVCAIFKQETRRLREWLEYHMLVGVERFWLYDNDSQPSGADEVLEPYVGRGLGCFFIAR